MRATLSYEYRGERFPHLFGSQVVVKEMADLAEIEYQLVKNRMGIKRTRTHSRQPVYIEDKDLLPRRRSRNSRRTRQEDENPFSSRWLKISLL